MEVRERLMKISQYQKLQHLGYARLYGLMRKELYWPAISRNVYVYCKEYTFIFHKSRAMELREGSVEEGERCLYQTVHSSMFP